MIVILRMRINRPGILYDFVNYVHAALWLAPFTSGNAFNLPELTFLAVFN